MVFLPLPISSDELATSPPLLLHLFFTVYALKCCPISSRPLTELLLMGLPVTSSQTQKQTDGPTIWELPPIPMALSSKTPLALAFSPSPMCMTTHPRASCLLVMYSCAIHHVQSAYYSFQCLYFGLLSVTSPMKLLQRPKQVPPWFTDPLGRHAFV